MAGPTLYLDNTATASPFPTTSKKLVTSAPSSEIQLGPGEFDSGFPGNTDSGQWNPSSAIADTTSSAEIDNTGASLGTTRQGWLYDVDLTGRKLKSGTWAPQLRLRANQGTGTAGRILVRATIITGSSGAWVTAANLLTTAITGETSHSNGQLGWRANEGSRITVTSTAANFSVTTATSSTEHTFSSGQRLLLEFGFGDGDSTSDRTWRLDYNTSNSFIVIPDLVDPIAGTSDGSATVSGTLTGKGVLSGTSAGVATATGTLIGRGALAGTSAGESTVSGTLTGAASGAISGTSDGFATASATLTGRGALVGISTGISTAFGTLTAQGALAGAAVGVSTATATLLGRGALVGVSAGLATVTATLTEAGGDPQYDGIIGIHIGGGVHVTMPPTWDGYLPCPPGWTITE